MNFSRRKFVRIFCLSTLFILTNFKYLFAATKKIINQNLSKVQKDIMFNEGTERAFTSSLLNEKRKGTYHCANCGALLFNSSAKYDSGTGWPSFSESVPGAFSTKVDYSARVQTVSKDNSKRYYDLISKFKEKTGCPVVVNTSFNVRGEPIVCTPTDAFNCFMGTELDYLVIGNCILDKNKQNKKYKTDYSKIFEED